MSILLNALNKHKDNSEQDEIDELIDNPIEETEDPRGNSSLPYLVIGLLAAIIFLLIVIIVLLIREPSATVSHPAVSASEQKVIEPSGNIPSAEVTPSSPKQTTPDESTVRARSQQENSATLTAPISAEQVPDKMPNVVVSNDRPIVETETNETANGSTRFIEQYQPKKYSTEDLQSSPELTKPAEKQAQAREFSSEQGIDSNKSYQSYSTGDIDTSLPLLEKSQLTEIQLLMVNEVSIGAHIYSEDDSQRFVFVDGQMKVEGDKLVNSWYLERIESDGVIINNNILRVRLPQ